MNILFFSDIHIREYGSFPPFNRINPDTGLTYECENALLGADFLCGLIREHKPELVVLGGDIVQTTEIQTARTLSSIARFLKKIKTTCEETNSYFIGYPGNHDILSTIHNITNTAMLEPWFNQYFEEPRIIKFMGKELGIIPYMDNREDFIITLNNFQSKCDLLFTHQDYNGCRYNSSSHTSTSVYSPKSKVPIISGDIHLPQVVGDVYYPGSLVQHIMEYPDTTRAGGAILAEFGSSFRANFIKNNLSKHYVKVTSSKEVLKFNPKEAVFLVITDEEPEEVHNLLKDYWYHYVPAPANKNSENVIVEMSQRVDPVDIMDGYISQNKPEAIPLFRRLIRKESNATES